MRMTSSPTTAHPSSVTPDRTDRITYGAVHLTVCDLDRSLVFWRDLIGLHALASDSGQARLGVDGRSLIVLHAGAQRPVGQGHAGLYHVAVHLPDATEFARVLARLILARTPQSPTDHVFSKATYLNDPDGILLELTLETPERFAAIEIGARSVVMIDSEGRRRGPTESLDIDEALAPLGDNNPQARLPGGTRVGHVHLHVPDLQAAHVFYRDVVGFDAHAYMPPYGMADLSAGGAFPHRLALNDWHGPGARQPQEGVAGMSRFELVVGEGGQLDALAGRLDAAGVVCAPERTGALVFTDPAGNTIAASAAVVPSGT